MRGERGIRRHEAVGNRRIIRSSAEGSAGLHPGLVSVGREGDL